MISFRQIFSSHRRGGDVARQARPARRLDPESERFEALETIVRQCVGRLEADKWRAPMLLPDESASFEDAPPRILVILFTSRTGSSYVGRLMGNTPYFREIREAFNPWHLERFRQRWRLADDGEAARGFIAKDGTEHAFGAKCGAAGLVGALYTGFLPALLDRMTFVTLKRRDTIAQAISEVKAQRSGRYHSSQERGVEVSVGDYDRSAIDKKVALIDRLNANLERFCQMVGKPSPVFFYEDICAEPLGFANTICELLGLPAVAELSHDVGLEILRDDISRQWRERYAAGG